MRSSRFSRSSISSPLVNVLLFGMITLFANTALAQNSSADSSLTSIQSDSASIGANMASGQIRASHQSHASGSIDSVETGKAVPGGKNPKSLTKRVGLVLGGILFAMAGSSRVINADEVACHRLTDVNCYESSEIGKENAAIPLNLVSGTVLFVVGALMVWDGLIH